MGGSWQSNKDDIINQIRGGGWTVAFGRELTEEDAAEGAVAAGVSIFIEDPGPVLAWLDELITESLDQMGASIVNTFTPVARQEAIQFSKGVITNLLQGKNAGEQLLNLFHFNLKAGVAQFIGQNFVWVPDVSPDGILQGLSTGDTGGNWQFVPPNVISYCPYIGLRFNPSVGNPAPSPNPSLQRIQWIGDNGAWFEMQQPGMWHEFVGLQQPQFTRAFQETGRDANYVYLKDLTSGSNMELALGPDREFYHYTDGQPGWHPDVQGHWRT